jgi:hypothetical protein
LALVPRSGAKAHAFHGVLVWSEPARAAARFADHGHHDCADVLDGGRCFAGFSGAAEHDAGVFLVPLDDGDIADDGNDVAPDDAFVVLKGSSSYAIVPHAIEEPLAELRDVWALIASRLRCRGLAGEVGIELTLGRVENFVGLPEGRAAR